MTYDELINAVLEQCYQGKYENWTVTDDSCAQMRKPLPKGGYLFVDFAQSTDDPDHVSFRCATVYIDEYSDGELWFYGSMYYATQDEFFGLGAEIMAECVAENKMEIVFDGTAQEVYDFTQLIWGE